MLAHPEVCIFPPGAAVPCQLVLIPCTEYVRTPIRAFAVCSMLTAARPTDSVIPKRVPLHAHNQYSSRCRRIGLSFVTSSVRLFDDSRAGPRGCNYSNAIGEMIGAAIRRFSLHACIACFTQPYFPFGRCAGLAKPFVVLEDPGGLDWIPWFFLTRDDAATMSYGPIGSAVSRHGPATRQMFYAKC